MRRLLFLFLTGLFLVQGVAYAAPRANNAHMSEKDLKTLERKIKQEKKASLSMKKKAGLIATEIMNVKKKMVLTARTIQEQEAALNRLERNLSQLQKDQNTVMKELKSKDGQLVKISTTIQRMALRPAESLLAQPMPPVDALRSAILLREMVAPLEHSAEKLRHNLNILSSLKAASHAQAAQIKIASSRLEDKHRHMKKLLSQKKSLQNRFEIQSKQAGNRAKSLAKQANNLKDLLNRLEREKKKRVDAERRQRLAIASLSSLTTKPEIKPTTDVSVFEKAKGKLSFPVVGKIKSLFGSKKVSSMFAKGMTIMSRKNAQVITPFDGTILYSGPFKSYGNLLIIEHAPGYHSLLSGLEQIDVSTGQTLLAGEPVGIMSTKAPSSLYIELRKDNEAIDPLPWFARK